MPTPFIAKSAESTFRNLMVRTFVKTVQNHDRFLGQTMNEIRTKIIQKLNWLSDNTEEQSYLEVLEVCSLYEKLIENYLVENELFKDCVDKLTFALSDKGKENDRLQKEIEELKDYYQRGGCSRHIKKLLEESE